MAFNGTVFLQVALSCFRIINKDQKMVYKSWNIGLLLPATMHRESFLLVTDIGCFLSKFLEVIIMLLYQRCQLAEFSAA